MEIIGGLFLIDNLILTKNEEQMTMFCEDFCPIHEAVKEYNSSHSNKIYCSTVMCKNVTNTYVLNLRERRCKNEI